jgi:hypothetical protein
MSVDVIQITGATSAIAVGQVVCDGPVVGGPFVQLATPTALAAVRAVVGVAITGGSPPGTISVAVSGLVQLGVTGLGNGVACAVTVDSAGNLKRLSDPSTVHSKYIVGYCDALGNLLVSPRREPSFNVLDYGADPSGATDSYSAFQDWAHAITATGGGVGLVPPGIYTIDQVINWDSYGVYHSDVRNIVFDRCNGLRLGGYGATINLKGNILKTRDYTSPHGDGSVYYANLKMVGFVIQNCDNVCIEGFDINGNANLVTEDSDSTHTFAEGPDYVLSICGSRNVTIRNMRVHHGWTDGISVRRTYPIAPSTVGIGCQQVVIENCEVYANARCNISGLEVRHMRISDSRLHHGGFTGGVIAYSPACNIDIEPDPVETDLSPADWSADTGTPSSLRFIILENCEFVDSNLRNVAINVRFSHFVVRGCFFNNSNNDQQPCVFSVPHCSIQDSEIDTSTGRIDVALTGTLPGGNVFTMERCLIRATSGEGLFIIANVGRIAQALIANCRFICEATSSTAKYFPYMATGQDMLMLTFRDNYIFIPSASYSGSGQKICSTAAVSLAENNVWETDYAGGGVNFLGVYYHTDASVYPRYPILVRNERFISPDGTGIRTADVSDHDNDFPFSGGISAIGDEIHLGKLRIRYGGASAPTSGSFTRGTLIFNTNVNASQSMGWVCVKGGTAGVDAVFKAMPLLGA